MADIDKPWYKEIINPNELSSYIEELNAWLTVSQEKYLEWKKILQNLQNDWYTQWWFASSQQEASENLIPELKSKYWNSIIIKCFPVYTDPNDNNEEPIYYVFYKQNYMENISSTSAPINEKIIAWKKRIEILEDNWYTNWWHYESKEMAFYRINDLQKKYWDTIIIESFPIYNNANNIIYYVYYKKK